MSYKKKGWSFARNFQEAKPRKSLVRDDVRAKWQHKSLKSSVNGFHCSKIPDNVINFTFSFALNATSTVKQTNCITCLIMLNENRFLEPNVSARVC